MMKKLLGWIFNGWVLAILGLLAISLLIWIVGPIIGIGEARPFESSTVRLALIGAIVLLYVLQKLWKAWSARRTNSAVVKHMLAEAPKGGTDAASAELATINERFQKALSTPRWSSVTD